MERIKNNEKFKLYYNFLIQENELGKVEMPPIYVSNIDSAASAGTAKPKARKRRRGIRSRRN